MDSATFVNQCINSVRPLLSVRPFVQLLHFFFIVLNELIVLYFTQNWCILKYNTQEYAWKQNFIQRYNKISSKMYKRVVQQKAPQKVQQNVQQKLHNNHVALLIKQFVFTKLVESLY